MLERLNVPVSPYALIVELTPRIVKSPHTSIYWMKKRKSRILGAYKGGMMGIWPIIILII
jgi:hypothetical protein